MRYSTISRPLRVLHCPDMVGGQMQHLARVERTLGLESWSVVWQANQFRYLCDEVICPPGSGRFLKERRRLLMLMRALTRYDVIHFNFGRSLMPDGFSASVESHGGWRERMSQRIARWWELADLPMLKCAGKTIVVTFQGDDARQGDRLQEYGEVDLQAELESGYYTPASDVHKRWRIEKFARYADRIYAMNPDLFRVLPEKTQFLPYCHVDLENWQPRSVPHRERPLVLHAPTHRGIKGTRHVLAAVEQLRREGVPFDFRLVEGLSHAEAMQQFREADLVVDQLILGWYGGLAVECMALGVPVVAHIRQSDLRFLPPGMNNDIPILLADTRSIASVLREWLTVRRSELPRIGRQSRSFVERWHDPVEIGRTIAADYRTLRSGTHSGTHGDSQSRRAS